ncbi:MAG: PAS domain S-box protein [Desulfobacterales bacterium]|nr:MAG: PAS domain S-box protein [Desulfobacterales bacterium]
MTESRFPSHKNNNHSDDEPDQLKSRHFKRRYADYFDFAPVGHFTFDRAGVILNVNSAGALLLGTDRESLLNKPFSAFISHDSQPVFDSHHRLLFETRQIQTCDVRLLSKNRPSPWVQLESVPVRCRGAKQDHFRSVIKEITRRKEAEAALLKTREELAQRVAERTAELEKINAKLRQQIVECEHAEAALRESEQKYSTLVEDALIGVYIIKDGKIEFANDKFAEIYGYEKDELIGMDASILVHPIDRLLVAELREKRLKGEKVPSEYEIRGLKKNGDVIWVMRSLSLINYKDGPAISGIVQDMTKRRMVEDALRESGKELRILSNQFLSTEEKERKRIARELHDGIGQALSAIKFSVENSLRELRNRPNHSDLKSLEAVIPLTQKTIEEVRRIVQDLRPAILDDLGILATITWFCREFQKVYARIEIKKDIDIKEKDIPSPLKTVVYRILQEALNNVAKHSRADTVRLGLKRKNNTIEFKVHDNGQGFDFAKAISLTSSRRGFGLASMRERAELSGATFEIDSSVGSGTTIRMRWEV